jgi:glucose-6-phosphate 1-dehydrogenase
MTAPAFLLFGANGDLALRMLWPSLFRLHCDTSLPQHMTVYGISRSGSTAELHAHLRKSLADELNADNNVQFEHFLTKTAFITLDANQTEDYQALAAFLAEKKQHVALAYLSMPPDLFTPIVENLYQVGLLSTETRIILEKPIGKDLASSCAISDGIAKVLHEQQTYRIDHYLGKEAVQNLLALRFANSIFEPLWNSVNIKSVHINIAESLGIGGRWGYYDKSGALRDMVQNHMLQLISLVAMEPPVNASSEAIRNEKIKVLQALHPITEKNLHDCVVFGQYAASASGELLGYNDEYDAKHASQTETFVAIKAFVDNWRWKGVPFYLKTGKRLDAKHTEVVIEFKEVPQFLFGQKHNGHNSNRLVIQMQPDESITLEIFNKTPEVHEFVLKPVALNLEINDAANGKIRHIAYERLIRDAIKGDRTLFVRRDELEQAWAWIDQIHTAWKASGMHVQSYPAGSVGPALTHE